MTSKILKSILSVAVAVLLATLLVITGVLYQYFGGVQQSQLKDELSLAASATEQLGEKYLETLSSDRYRLTWVAPDGTVLFDTRADAAAMENHADREEIKEAMTSGSGSSSRNSATLTEQTIYEATRLEDGRTSHLCQPRYCFGAGFGNATVFGYNRLGCYRSFCMACPPHGKACG